MSLPVPFNNSGSPRRRRDVERQLTELLNQTSMTGWEMKTAAYKAELAVEVFEDARIKCVASAGNSAMTQQFAAETMMNLANELHNLQRHG